MPVKCDYVDVSGILWYYHLQIECQNCLAFIDYIDKEKNISDINFRVNEIIRSPQVRLIDAAGRMLASSRLTKPCGCQGKPTWIWSKWHPVRNHPSVALWILVSSCMNVKRRNVRQRNPRPRLKSKRSDYVPKPMCTIVFLKRRMHGDGLDDGMKVRVSIRFRGREIVHPEVALEDLKEIAEELKDIATVEQAPSLEGKMMGMTLTPAKVGKKRSPPPIEKPKSKGKTSGEKAQPAGSCCTCSTR